MAEPSPKETYPRNAEKTRARILAAAVELFSNSSYDKVRSRDIAGMAGVDVALINRYFGSKKDLFSAVLAALSSEHPEFCSDDLESRLCEDFSKRLKGEDFRRTSATVRLLAFSASCPEVAPLLQEHMTGEIAFLADLLPSRDRTEATALIAYIVGVHTLLRMVPEGDRAALDPEVLLEPLRSVFHRGAGGNA